MINTKSLRQPRLSILFALLKKNNGNGKSFEHLFENKCSVFVILRVKFVNIRINELSLSNFFVWIHRHFAHNMRQLGWTKSSSNSIMTRNDYFAKKRKKWQRNQMKEKKFEKNFHPLKWDVRAASVYFCFVEIYLTVNHTWRLEMTPRFSRIYKNKFVTILILNRLPFNNVKLLKHVRVFVLSTSSQYIINYFFYFHAYWTQVRQNWIVLCGWWDIHTSFKHILLILLTKLIARLTCTYWHGYWSSTDSSFYSIFITIKNRNLGANFFFFSLN